MNMVNYYFERLESGRDLPKKYALHFREAWVRYKNLTNKPDYTYEQIRIKIIRMVKKGELKRGKWKVTKTSRDLGEIILDKMITVLWNQDRFKVMERAALNQILAEQSLGQTGVLDATTAAKIGKGIGVDAIIIGSVAAAASGALSIDTRVIDTESAAIIVAHDAYTGSSDAQSVKNAVENLARKITESLPLVDGYVIRIDGPELIIDVGRNGGLKRGMKCVIYKEGAPIKHPITGEILGKETSVIGEVLVTDAFDKYSVAKQLSSVGGVISIGDKFITK